MTASKRILDYLDFINNYGLPYTVSDHLRIITDYEKLINYYETHNKPIGIIYKSEYNILIVDLVENVTGDIFPYERIVKVHRGNSVVIIPEYNGKYVLLKQFRHALGDYQYAFPRGFGEPDITIEDNTKKEIFEELNANASDIILLGKVVADSGLCGEKVNIVQCKIDKIHIDRFYEGIENYSLLSTDEITKFIRSGIITDGFTLSAWSMLIARL